MDNGFTSRDAVDADIEKTADASAEDKRSDFEQPE
jgi:hypothetical protein